MANQSGILVVHPASAKLVRDVETFGTMDPYCMIKVGKQTLCSNIDINAGKFPNWKEQFNFLVTNEDSLEVSIWDRRPIKGDEEIGNAKIPLANIFLMKNFEGWFAINFQEKNAGQVFLRFVYYPVNLQHGAAEGGFYQFGYIKPEYDQGFTQIQSTPARPQHEQNLGSNLQESDKIPQASFDKPIEPALIRQGDVIYEKVQHTTDPSHQSYEAIKQEPGSQEIKYPNLQVFDPQYSKSHRLRPGEPGYLGPLP
ncbi:unnamed protein product [Blepharisma stoltei]|uniref:C2 domain-containing protein n=1 Tax=Blepharisma stoltei TaxID=1481888 RepID=A0AAU9IIX3_9CILI|nr:unnamed protein product [Blepharisma stoltei]